MLGCRKHGEQHRHSSAPYKARGLREETTKSKQDVMREGYDWEVNRRSIISIRVKLPVSGVLSPSPPIQTCHIFIEGPGCSGSAQWWMKDTWHLPLGCQRGHGKSSPLCGESWEGGQNKVVGAVGKTLVGLRKSKKEWEIGGNKEKGARAVARDGLTRQDNSPRPLQQSVHPKWLSSSNGTL